MAKQVKWTKALVDLISEHLFLAFTDQQIAYVAEISERTYHRLKASPEWQQVKRAELAREAFHRRRIWKGEPGWQGAAWMLERKYASQLSKPEVQLSLNTGASVTNNTLVITAEQAQGLRNRNVALDEQLSKLSPPSARAVIPDVIHAAQVLDNQASLQNEPFDGKVSSEESLPNNNELAKTLSSSVVLAPEGAAPTGTPDAAATTSEPFLPPKSKSVENSSNYRPGIDPPLKKKPGAKKQEKNLENFNPPRIEKPQSLNPLAPLQALDKKRPGRPKRGTENVSLPPAPRGPKAGRK